jgi:hypothetical protein
MVAMSTFSFYILLEAIIVLLILLSLAVWRLRKTRGDGRLGIIEASEGYPPPSLYLDSEAAKTRTFVTNLKDRPEQEPTDPALRASLGARAHYLRYESERARTPVHERDLPAWTALAREVALLLSAEGYVRKAEAVHIHGEDSQTSVVLSSQQEQTIQHLREYIQELLEALGHQPTPEANIEGRFNELDRVNEELKLCVTILEDENEFLRKQIAALLKLTQAEDDTTPTRSSSAG